MRCGSFSSSSDYTSGSAEPIQLAILNNAFSVSLSNKRTIVVDRIDQSLAEQIRLDKYELDYRKRLLKFERVDALVLASVKPYIKPKVNRMVEEFYAHQREFREITELIGDRETMRRLQLAMHDYILELFDGHYDEVYVNRRLRIGKVHKRIGVPPKLYLASMRELETIIKQTICEIDDSDLPEKTKKKALGAIEKLITFDTQFVLDTYIESLVNEVEIAKSEMVDYANSLEQVVAERTSELKQLSIEDSLTGLYNQRYFQSALRKELSRAERDCTPLTLGYLDIDNFKQINDQHGHQKGDRLLEGLGQIIKETLRISDIGCRYGGDEFCIICPNTNREGAENILKRILEKFHSQGHEKYLDLSIGISTTGPSNFETSDALIRLADTAMYMSKEQAKKGKGNKIIYYDEEQKKSHLKLAK